MPYCCVSIAGDWSESEFDDEEVIIIIIVDHSGLLHYIVESTLHIKLSHTTY